MNETTRLFVGGLPWKMTQENLKKLFEEGEGTATGCGEGSVKEAVVVLDRESNRSKGFGFVEIFKEHAEKAIEKFNGFETKAYDSGRTLTVSVAEPRADRSRSSSRDGGDRRNFSRDSGDRGRFSGGRGNNSRRERY